MKLITKNQYMKQYKVGYPKVLEMIANGELKLQGGKIIIYDETVSYEEYTRVVKENTELRTKLEMIKQMI